jgi:hypothetical protein
MREGAHVSAQAAMPHLVCLRVAEAVADDLSG